MDQVYEGAISGLTSHEDKIRESHKHCANMRSTRSISSSCISLKHLNEDKYKYFPVSVCCTSDYCMMTANSSPFKYSCDDTDNCFLYKDDLIVQALPNSSESHDECYEKNQNNINIYKLLPETTRQDICQT
jgi:hypothetical protein